MAIITFWKRFVGYPGKCVMDIKLILFVGSRMASGAPNESRPLFWMGKGGHPFMAINTFNSLFMVNVFHPFLGIHIYGA